jgi:glycosyl transferase family 2
MHFPAVSVVMSVFNGERFVSEAIDSILAQTYRDFEFIIIDDGSTDRTPEILANYGRRDGRISVHRRANQGRCLSLNAGINIANGKYIARMDADDISLPDRLEEQIRFMDAHPEVGLLGGAFKLIGASGRVLRTIGFPSKDSEIRSAMLSCNPFAHPTVVIRKDVVTASGGYRRALLDADDYDLWLRVSERSRLANLEKCVLLYRIHAKQVSIQNMRHQKMCVLAASAAALQRSQGRADPLSGVEEITPQFLTTLGVTAAQVQQAVLGGYHYWMDILGETDPEAALAVINGFLESSDSRAVGRPLLADAWLQAASIHFRLGRRGKALTAAVRGMLMRPIVAGRPIKRALQRLTATKDRRG